MLFGVLKQVRLVLKNQRPGRHFSSSGAPPFRVDPARCAAPCLPNRYIEGGALLRAEWRDAVTLEGLWVVCPRWLSPLCLQRRTEIRRAWGRNFHQELHDHLFRSDYGHPPRLATARVAVAARSGVAFVFTSSRPRPKVIFLQSNWGGESLVRLLWRFTAAKRAAAGAPRRLRAGYRRPSSIHCRTRVQFSILAPSMLALSIFLCMQVLVNRLSPRNQVRALSASTRGGQREVCADT